MLNPFDDDYSNRKLTGNFTGLVVRLDEPNGSGLRYVVNGGDKFGYGTVVQIKPEEVTKISLQKGDNVLRGLSELN